MNFIRFVKTPRLDVRSKSKPNAKAATKIANGNQLSMILNITTDFSLFASSIELRCQFISSNDTVLQEKQVPWMEYDREVRVELSVPSTVKEGRVVIKPVKSPNSNSDSNFLSTFLGGETAHIVSVETSLFSLAAFSRNDTVYRTFYLPSGPLRIAEQSGETIIRHVWDAGIILSAALICNPPSALPRPLQPFITAVMPRSGKLKVLEVGCGVGILGVSIAAAFPQSQVVMTDLSDAQSLVEENIHLNSAKFPHLKQNAAFRALDWEMEIYPEWTVTDRYDLIVMADVTYNTATFIPLVKTLQHLLRNGSRGSKVICCGKQRHDEEEGFWRLVAESGFMIDSRIIFGMDLEGNFRHCISEEKEYGEQLIDFVCMHI